MTNADISDWFLDRFRTVINVSGDIYAARIFEVQTGIKDSDEIEEVDPTAIFGQPRRPEEA